MSDHHEGKVLERIENSLQHLARESRKTREELRLLREILLLILKILRDHDHHRSRYPRTVGITVKGNL